MKAGLLREILEFREEVKSQDLNGLYPIDMKRC